MRKKHYTYEGDLSYHLLLFSDSGFWFQIPVPDFDAKGVKPCGAFDYIYEMNKLISG